jgi:hypothetical protein
VATVVLGEGGVVGLVVVEVGEGEEVEVEGRVEEGELGSLQRVT